MTRERISFTFDPRDISVTKYKSVMKNGHDWSPASNRITINYKALIYFAFAERNSKTYYKGIVMEFKILTAGNKKDCKAKDQ